MTVEEQKAHFALWCIMSSPLMLGSDPICMGADELKIVANKTAIAINQDPTEQGTRIAQDGTAEIWAKKLADGKVAVLLLNRDKQQAQDITLPFKLIGLKKSQTVLDVYENTSLGKIKESLTKSVPPSAGLFLLIGK
jgi:alpha-galactosidase